MTSKNFLSKSKKIRLLQKFSKIVTSIFSFLLSNLGYIKRKICSQIYINLHILISTVWSHWRHQMGRTPMFFFLRHGDANAKAGGWLRSPPHVSLRHDTVAGCCLHIAAYHEKLLWRIMTHLRQYFNILKC